MASHSRSGSKPPRIGPHSPSFPSPLRSPRHAMHRSLHPVSQQTSSTQCPERHSAPLLQGSPRATPKLNTCAAPAEASPVVSILLMGLVTATWRADSPTMVPKRSRLLVLEC